MLGFRVIEGSLGVELWPIDSGVTLYNGQLCQEATTGMGPLAAATGAADASGLQVISGIVVGNDAKVSANDATYGNYISGVTTAAAQNARDYRGNSANFPAGDQKPKVYVERIGPQTLIRGFVGGSATVHTTNITLLTVTTGGTTSFVSNATQFTPVANMASSYCRTGANMGIQEISNDTSTTTEGNTIAFPQTIAVGDTFVRVPYKLGKSWMNINTTSGKLGMWINGTVLDATNAFLIYVKSMSLQKAGEETIDFYFAPCHFDAVRA